MQPAAMSRFIGSETSILGFGVSVSTRRESPLATILRSTALGLLPLLAKHANDIVEGLFNIDAVLSGGLDEFAAQLLRQGLTLLRGDGALDGLVALVADKHDGDGQWGPGRALHGRGEVAGAGGGAGASGLLDHLDLVVEFGDARERGARCDTVDQYETLAISNPLVAQCGVFFLARRVQHLEHARLLVDDDLFAVGVFDGGIVGFDEVIETELG